MEGALHKVGYKFKQQVLVFHLDNKMIRKGILVNKNLLLERENNRISAGEYILLILLGEDENPNVNNLDHEFNDLLETERELQ